MYTNSTIIVINVKTIFIFSISSLCRLFFLDGKTRRFDSNCKLNSENNAERNNCTNKQDYSLNLASPREFDKTLELLRNKGEDDYLHEENSIYSTCQNGQDSDFQLSLTNCFDVNLCSTQGSSPSSVASDDVHESNVQLVIENRANVNDKNGRSPLIMACKSGHDNVVGRLIAKGADVNLCDASGFSPLAVASSHGHESIVHFLVENGSNVNWFEKNGASPLYMACQYGLDNVVKFLIKNGADVNLCNSLGFSPLAVASEHGHDSTVQLLVENGSNVNLFENNGRSPLCMACQGGHDNIVACLIMNGADVNLCDSSGFSPLAVATYHGHESIVQLLT